MNTSASSDGRSGSSSWEMQQASALCNKQWTTLNLVDMHLMALQNLVRSHDERNNIQQPGSPDGNENMETGSSSSSLPDVFGYIEQIRQVVNEEKNSLPLTPSELLLWNRTNQNEDLSVDASAVVERALNNSVVLRTVMSHMNANDLLRCRLVSKSWKEEATLQIVSTRRWQKGGIFFSWDDWKQKYTNKIGTLKELTESCFSDPHGKLPCFEFRFLLKNENEQPSADLFKFFSNHGHFIKRLCLISTSNSTAVFKIVCKIIFEWTPNLESLRLAFPFCENGPPTQDVQQMSEADDDDDSQISPSSLGCLQEVELVKHDQPRASVVLKRSKRLVSHILSSAPNLKRVLDRDLWFTQEITSSGKIKATAIANVYAMPPMVSRFMEFSRIQPQLTHLDLDVEDFLFEPDQIPGTNLFASLQTVLESSRSTLKTLHLRRRLHFNFEDSEPSDMFAEYEDAPLFTFPIMENLEKITLKWFCPFEGGEGWILPVGFAFQDVLPRLKTLNLEYHPKSAESNEMCRTDNPFTNRYNSSATVEALKIYPGFESCFRFEWMRQVPELYPNVRVLDLKIEKDWMELPQLCSSIWKWWKTSSLEELKINVDSCKSYQESNGNFAEIMDQVLTGFNKRTCNILRKRSGADNRQGDEGIWRRPSILDMTKLKVFDLVYYSSKGLSLFSRVSVIHAFDPMRKRQNLRVRIGGADLEEMIQYRNVDFPPPLGFGC